MCYSNLVTKNIELKNSKLADIAPTILDLLGEVTHIEMTDETIIKKS